MPKKKQPLDLTPDWQAARDYHAATITHACLTAAAAVLTGWKLFHIKKTLGFMGSGKRAKVAKLATLTWEQWLEQEIPGLKRRTADHRIAAYDAAKRNFTRGKQDRLIELLDAECLTNKEHEELQKLVHKCLDNQTVSDIFRDAQIEKLPQGSAANGGNLDGSATKKPKPSMEQLAFALFTDPVQELCKLRAHCDYKKAINALPVTSPDPETVTLSAIEQHAKALLADVEQAKAKAAKGNS